MMSRTRLPERRFQPRWKISKAVSRCDIFPDRPIPDDRHHRGVYEHLHPFNIGHVSVQCPGPGAWEMWPFAATWASWTDFRLENGTNYTTPPPWTDTLGFIDPERVSRGRPMTKRTLKEPSRKRKRVAPAFRVRIALPHRSRALIRTRRRRDGLRLAV